MLSATGEAYTPIGSYLQTVAFLRDPSTDRATGPDEVALQRTRRGELENQTLSDDVETLELNSERNGRRLLKVIIVALLAINAATVPLAYLTLRRWHRWWELTAE